MNDKKKEETHDGNEKDLQTGNPLAGQKARAAGGKSHGGGHVNSQSNRQWTPGLFLEGETPEQRRAGRPRQSDGERREKEEKTCAVTRAEIMHALTDPQAPNPATPPKAALPDIEWPNDVCVCGLMRIEHRGEHSGRRCQQFVLRVNDEPWNESTKAGDRCTYGHDRSLHAHGFDNLQKQRVWHNCDDCRCMHFVLDNRLRHKLDDSRDLCACGHKRSEHGRVILTDTIIDACSGGDLCGCESWQIASRGEG
jgi:hypothetical protein